jgi:hypothetical protein
MHMTDGMATGKEIRIKHLAINARLLHTDSLEGIGPFTHEVVQKWAQMFPQVRFSLLAGHKLDPQFQNRPNLHPVNLPPPPRHPLLYLAWFNLSVRAWQAWAPPDVFFTPDGYLAQGAPTPQVGVIHDLGFSAFPRSHRRTSSLVLQ